MSNRPSSSFGATDSRVYVVNNRVPVYDFNSEAIKLDLSNNVVPILNSINNELNNLTVGITGPIGLTGSVSLTAGSLVGITGPVSVTGAVSVSNFPSTFGITGPVTVNINGVTGVNGRLPTYDASATYAINNHAIKAMIDDGEGTLTLQDLQGVISASGYNSLSVYNYDLDTKFHNDSTFTNAIETVVKNQVGITGAVSLSTGTTVGITGPFIYGNFLGVTGSFATTTDISGQYVNISKLPPVSITGPVSLSTGTTVGLTGEFVYNGFLGVTGNFGTVTMGAITISGNQFVGITGTALVKDISANATLTLIESDISSGILVKGQDDTGTRYPIYVDVDGVQRTEIVEAHAETAKYIFETDATVIATGTSWGLDNRDREGWYYSGTTSSTLKWYGNNGISNPPSLEFNKMQAVWMIATLDDVTAAPKIRVVTSASTWDYTIPSPGVTIYNGEQYLFHYGTKAVALNPAFHPITMVRALISGPGANNEVISEINIVTGTSTNFLLNKTGIWDQYISQQFATVFRDIRAQTAEDNLISLDFSGTQLKTVATIDGPVSLASGTTVGLATDTLVAINAAFVGSGTPVYDNVNMVSTPYSTFAGLQTYANELNTAAHLRADLWDAGYTGSQYFQVRPSATVSATGPSGLQLISLSTTVDNKATNPANMTIIGGITGSVSVTGIVSTNDISANTTLSAINTKMVQQYNTTNDFSKIGLNTYVIEPKRTIYSFSGSLSVATTGMMIAGTGSNIGLTNANNKYGIANVKPWYAYSPVATTINYEYVDINGAIGNGSTSLALNTWKQLPLQSGSNGSFLINKFATTNNLDTGTLYIAYTSGSTTTTVYSAQNASYYSSVFTCPANSIAWISSFNWQSTSADYPAIIKFSSTGVRSVVYQWNVVTTVNYPFCEIGYITAGESLAVAGYEPVGGRTFIATIVCKSMA